MTGQARLMLIGGVILATILALFASGSAGSAATLEGRWSLYDRQDATSFKAGTTPFLGSGSLPGYEIVGMDARGVTESMDTYQYWGASAVPPVPEIVSCEAAITPPLMSLSIQGAYPFGGCVFFLGVTNAGESDLRVELGPAPGDTLPVACFGGPCVSSDVDVLAGGHTQADIAERCAIFGSGPGGVIPDGDSLTYRISPEYTFVCPLFVVVMQPACENCEYSFEITPAPTETPTPVSSETPPLVSETQVTSGSTSTPTPTPTLEPPTATPTATPETPSPTPTDTATATPTFTPVDEVGGVRTPGATATPTRTPASSVQTAVPTPRPPSSGNGVLVRRDSDGPHPIVPIGLIAVATLLCLAIAWPGNRPATNGSYVMVEASGGRSETPVTRQKSRARRLIDRIRRLVR